MGWKSTIYASQRSNDTEYVKSMRKATMEAWSVNRVYSPYPRPKKFDMDKYRMWQARYIRLQFSYVEIMRAGIFEGRDKCS
jgi:hypothetical protein